MNRDDMRKIEIPVTGMSCANCARSVEQALSDTEGVDEAGVNVASARASVLFSPRLVKPADLVRKIRDAGYDVASAKIEIPVQGLHCASCVGRVEAALLDLRGVVSASVNLATNRASVEYLPNEIRRAEIEAAVEAAGYGIVRASAAEDEEDVEATMRDRELRRLRFRFTIGLAFSLAIMAGSMGISFPGFPAFLHQPFLLWALATPVQFWVGARFYKDAWAAFKHRART